MLLKSIVLFPGAHRVNEVSDTGEQEVSVRVARRFDDFALALGCHTAAEIHVEDAAAMPEPIDNGIFICRPEVLERSLAKQPERVHFLSSRTVVVDLVRTHALAMGGALRAGCGRSGRTLLLLAKTTINVLGRRLSSAYAASARKKDSLSPPTQPPDGQTYALLHHSGFSDLPAFLIAYLNSYVANL